MMKIIENINLSHAKNIDCKDNFNIEKKLVNLNISSSLFKN